MTDVYHKCEVCGVIKTREETYSFVIYKKWKLAKRNKDKSIGTKLVCSGCYKKIFGGKDDKRQ